MFRSIEEDATKVLAAVKCDIEDLRSGTRTRTIMTKKHMIYAYLRKECGYSWHEIADYCHKDHSTIINSVKNNTKLYELHRVELLKLTQDTCIHLC